MPESKTTIYFLRVDYHDGSVGAYDIFKAQDYWKVEEVVGLPDNEYCCQDMASAHASRLFQVERGRFVRSDGTSGPETTELRVAYSHGKEDRPLVFYGQIKLCPFCGADIELEEGLEAVVTRIPAQASVLRESNTTSKGQLLASRVFVDGRLATERKDP